MKMNKDAFMAGEFGSELECMIHAWEEALEKNSSTGADMEVLRTLAWCQAQWEVYRMAIRHFYGVEYHFSRTDEYYGLCTEDESDWLMKVDRGSVKCILCEDEDVTEALRRAWKKEGMVLCQEKVQIKRELFSRI